MNIRIVLRSILALSRAQLLELAMNPVFIIFTLSLKHGSRFVEALFKSPLVLSDESTEASVAEAKATNVQTLVMRFKGKFGDLACDSSGCHIVEACFNAANAEKKEIICKELVEMEPKIGVCNIHTTFCI